MDSCSVGVVVLICSFAYILWRDLGWLGLVSCAWLLCFVLECACWRLGGWFDDGVCLLGSALVWGFCWFSVCRLSLSPLCELVGSAGTASCP